jgi:hypothetical protein
MTIDNLNPYQTYEYTEFWRRNVLIRADSGNCLPPHGQFPSSVCTIGNRSKLVCAILEPRE